MRADAKLSIKRQGLFHQAANRAFTATRTTVDDKHLIKFDADLRFKLETAVRQHGSRLNSLLIPCAGALFVHLVLLLLMQLSWQSQTDPLLAPQSAKPVPIKAYMFSQAHLQQFDETRQAESNTLDSKVLSIDVPQVRINTPTPAMRDTGGLRSPSIDDVADVVTTESSVAIHSSQETDNNAANRPSVPEAESLKGSMPSMSINQMTGSYLNRQRQNALEQLIAKQANRYTQPRSLSVMDSDMVELVLPQVDEFSNALSLDSRVDPHRIVKHGDTCYRIVSVATPINPYAENIGYPFKCGGDNVKQALKKALDERLTKMGVSQKSR
ncbi:hypothetical protein [Shewanella colwelliana]|uniref:hypothetical protein n=1 Tax=Shewanella colwelliana TaxID=23 RepID=UPI00299D80A9|nr:hypothetical protein [Shewanella colwelliana]MDX1282248.1 hypothetical protein [Shewanella colwelliana]